MLTELYCLNQDLGAHFLVRTCVDRLAGDGQHTIATEMTEVQVKGLHHVEVRDVNGDLTRVALALKCKEIVVQPPIGKQRYYPPLRLFVLHATERNPPRGRKAIEWKLITDLPVRSRQDAIEKIDWYAMHWKLEVFHKVLKSGCRAEDSKLRTADRLANFMAVFCILSWRVLWLTMMARAAPDESPDIALTRSEIRVLDGLVADTGNRRCKIGTLAFYIIKLARLGATLRAQAIRRPASSSFGAASHGSPKSNSARIWELPDLWVIESR